MEANWRHPVNQLLHSLSFSGKISDEHVAFCADSAINYSTLQLGPEAYYRAISEALASGQALDALGQVPQFDQAQLAEFLRDVAARLDRLRPWPEPKVRPLDPTEWGAFRSSRPIAQLKDSIGGVSNALQKGFRPIVESSPPTEVLMLRLMTGETIALLGSYGGGAITLLADAAEDPASVIDNFVVLTGYPRDRVTQV